MEIFQKYKNVGIEKDVKRVAVMNKLPLLVIGPPNIGKKTIIKAAYPDVKITDNINTITERANGYFYNCVCVTNIDKLKKADIEKLACYIERYSCFMNIICTTRSYNIFQKILDRCVKIHIKYPTLEDIKESVTPIMKSENIQYDISKFVTKSYHNILLELTLIQNNKPVDMLYDYDIFIINLCNNLHKYDYTKIRTELYKLLLVQISMTYVIKKAVNVLIKKHEHILSEIISEAAKFEARIHKGNKDIYHAEAFLFSIKKRI